MHILVATPLYPPEVGGPATYTKELESRLSERGFTVSVLPFTRFKRYPYIIRHIAYFGAVWRKMSACDAVYAQDPLGAGLPAICAARLRWKKVILRIAGDRAWETGVQKFGVTESLDTFAARWTYNPLIWILKIAQWKATLFAHHVIVPSGYLKRVVMDWAWGVNAEKITVIYNAALPEQIAETKAEIRTMHDITGPALLSAGRLVPWKGMRTLITILPAIHEQFPNTTLYIAGDGPEREHLKAEAKTQGVAEHVVFLGDLDKHALHRYMKAADAFVLNTGYEGFSHILLEAMHIGVPIITTDLGGNPELIQNGTEGILVSFNNKAELQAAITEVLSGQIDSAQLVANARTKAETFSIENTMDQLSHVLKTV